jgi:hypothetical protein
MLISVRTALIFINNDYYYCIGINIMDVEHTHYRKKTPHKNAEVSLNAYLTEDKVIQIMRKQLESYFPKVCASCQCRFETLLDYLSNTEQIGQVISYDVEMGNWKPLKPMGTVICANCRCGNTFTLTLKGMPLPQLWLLLAWIRVESQKRDMDPQSIWDYLLNEIRKQVSSDYHQKHILKKVVRQ